MQPPRPLHRKCQKSKKQILIKEKNGCDKFKITIYGPENNTGKIYTNVWHLICDAFHISWYLETGITEASGEG